MERMAACKPDVVSIDGSIDLGEAIRRVGPDVAVQVSQGVERVAGVGRMDERRA